MMHSNHNLCCICVDCVKCAYRTQDQQIKLTFISSEKSLVDVMTAVQQFDRVLPTVEVIKLAEVRYRYALQCIIFYIISVTASA